MAEQNNKNPLQALWALVVAGAAIWYFWGGGLEDQVASDSIETYKIAKRSGDEMQACVHAGIVSAAFLQSKNEEKYRQWQKTEKEDCELAHKKSTEDLEKKIWPNGKPEWPR
jgi:hypothetical protein